VIETRIPYGFAQRVGVNLSWTDVLEGLKRRILACDFAREKAVDELTEVSPQVLVDLAISDPTESVGDEVEQLALSEAPSSSTSSLLYVFVSYLRKHEQNTQRLLDLIEEVYADFDHRYMPMEGPDLGSLEANEQRLVADLDAYLAMPPPTSDS
jgi:hypothetical protein